MKVKTSTGKTISSPTRMGTGTTTRRVRVSPFAPEPVPYLDPLPPLAPDAPVPLPDEPLFPDPEPDPPVPVPVPDEPLLPDPEPDPLLPEPVPAVPLPSEPVVPYRPADHALTVASPEPGWLPP